MGNTDSNNAASVLRQVLPPVALVFVAVHASLRALPNPEAYEKSAEIFTHLFALPAILRARHMREQIIVATIVSTLYHALQNYSDMPNDDIVPYQRLDHAMSTALIATVFLKYFARLTHVLGVIVLFASLAASFPFGNVLSSALTAAIFVAIITVPCVDRTVYRIVGYMVYVLSLGGVVPEVKDINLAPYRSKLATAFLLQALSVVCYYVGETNTNLKRWSHSLWHVFAFLSLFVLVDVIALREDDEAGVAPVVRPSRKQFYNILR